MSGIKQNLFWAFIYNIIGIPLAAGAFYPIFGWVLNPVFAGLAMTRQGLGRVIAQVIVPGIPGEMEAVAMVSCVSPVSAGTYLDEGNRFLSAGSNSTDPAVRALMRQRGREKMVIGLALSGYDSNSVLYASLCDPSEEWFGADGLSRAVRESDIVSYPRNLMLKRYIALRIKGGIGLRDLAADLAKISAEEPFYISIYLYRGNIAGMMGNPHEERRLYRQAVFLSREARKRRGLNDYEKTLIEGGRFGIADGLEGLR